MKFPNRPRLVVDLAILLVGAALPVLAQQPQPSKPRTAATRPRSSSTSRPATPRARATMPASGRVDGVAAVVNDDVILQSDVEDQVYLFLSRNPNVQPDSTLIDTLRRQVLDQLIDEKLIIAEAKREGVSTSDAEVGKQVDAAIADARQRLGEEGFKAQLEKEGLTEEKLRARYRDEATRNVLAQRLLAKQFPKKSISQAEAEAYFKANPDKFPKASAELKLSVIQIPVRPDSVTDAAARAKILAARKRVLAGEKFAKVAADVSDDPTSARSGGDLGFFSPGQMEPAIEQAAFGLKLNTLSDPIHSNYGWHLIEVLERDTLKTASGRDSVDAQGKPVPEAHVRHILVRAQPSQEDADRTEALAKKVQADAAKGADFTTLVKKYSHYQGQAAPDGDIGFVQLNTLQPNIREGLEKLQPGQVSDVLANPVGYNIFKVTDKKPERAFTLEEIKDELPDAVAQIQFRERYETWVKSLRARAHIKINA